MWFCPLDGTLLKVVSRTDDPMAKAKSMFSCSTCPYSCPIIRSKSVKTASKRKQVDDILGGAEAWEHVDRTMATCPACNNKEAYFQQIQIRSADEPMSVFYKCCKCSFQWNDK
mmetsp:Transcript_35748/g.74383  ORF Transcript_35748/g.74383 Transcript_35748/m.74383 type:complete len:113 (-) Transcript_35748:1182-1520(-)